MASASIGTPDVATLPAPVTTTSAKLRPGTETSLTTSSASHLALRVASADSRGAGGLLNQPVSWRQSSAFLGLDRDEDECIALELGHGSLGHGQRGHKVTVLRGRGLDAAWPQGHGRGSFLIHQENTVSTLRIR